MKTKLTQEEMIQLLDTIYEKSLQGIPKVSQPINVLSDDYLMKHKTVDAVAKSFINYQVAKCATSGFVTGLGGLITLPAALPANIGSVLYVQIRMITCLAYMGGYNPESDQVQTLIYACLAGISVDQILKNFGIQFGTKLTTAMIKKIPGGVLTKINQGVGFRLVTKFGSKGLVNLGKAIPVVGGVISGGFDFAETSVIAKRAYKMFIMGELNITDGNSDDAAELIEAEILMTDELKEEHTNEE